MYTTQVPRFGDGSDRGRPRRIALLRRHGYRVRRLDDGVGEWRLAGLPVAAGAEPGSLH